MPVGARPPGRGGVVAKRGQRAIARVRYEWDNGIGGTKAFYSPGDAETFAQQIRDRAELLGRAVQVAIEPIEPKSR